MSEIIPSNWTLQERELASQTERVSAVPVLVREVWSPQTCPAGILPWLAWALHVDDWNANWSDDQKRATIAASIEIHRKKGTAAALVRALQAVGYEVEIDEATGIPYTFRVVLDVSQSGAEDSTYNLAESIANQNKNVRSKLLGITALLVSKGQAFFGAGGVSGEDTTVWPFILSTLEGTASAFIAAAEQTIDTVCVFPLTDPNQAFTGTLYSSGVVNIEMIYG
jgi:phage tail P2-like protein